MALDWLPIDARPPRLRRAPRGETITPFTAKTIPVPDILASLTFLPVDARPPRKVARPRTDYLLPPTAASFAPVSWLSSVAYPARLHPQPWSDVSEPPPGAQVVIAQRMSWLPQPSYQAHVTPPPRGETVEVLFPGIAAAGVPCAHLEDGIFTATTFVDEAVTAPSLLDEAASATTFVDEDLC